MYLLLILLTFIHPIDVKDAWLRPGNKGMNSAVYFEIKNNQSTADTLYAVKSNLARVTEMHETYKSGDMMGMRKTPFIVIPAKSAFSFRPGGHHIMLISLLKDIKPGSQETLTLRFRKAGDIRITPTVHK